MNQRLLSVLAFAFIVSAGASLLLYRLLAGRVTSQAPPTASKLILASRVLEPGSLVREGDLRIGDRTGPIPEGALLKQDQIVGRGVISTIFVNEPFIESRLAPKGGGAGLAALIPNGMRAVAIRVNEIVGVAGFVVPGMRVDVLVSGNPPGNTSGGSVTKTLLQYVEVLSAGQNFQKDTEGKPVSVQVVNLLVTPEQAEMLSLASSQTTIQLVLRNPLDTQIAKTPGTAVVQLFRSDMAFPRDEKLGQPVMARPTPRPARPVPLPSKPRVVEIILGIKRADTQFTPAVVEVKP
jgi:pilus assembly protein CpaB